MTLLRAAAYRLFSGKGVPLRSLYCRGVLFGCCLGVLSFLLLRTAPELQTLNRLQVVYLTFAIVSMVVNLVYIGTAYIQHTMLRRVQVFFQLPMRMASMRRLFWMAYLPAIAVSADIALSVVWRLFGASHYTVQACIAGLSALFLGIVFNTMIRITRTIFNPGARIISAIVVLCMAAVIWQAITSSPGLIAGYITAFYAVAATVISLWLFKAPLASVHQHATRVVREWRTLNLFTALFVRAFRTARYVGANTFLVFLLVGLSCVAWYKPVVPFDGVCVLVLILAGTLGQEARSLSRHRYPLELMLYGQRGIWLRSTWSLAIVNAAFFTDLLLAIAIVWFPDGVGINYMQAASIGVGLVGAALAAASLIIPDKDDIGAQLLSTAVYGGLAWLVLHTFTRYTSFAAVSIVAGCMLACLTLSYWCEYVRWILTIRGKYVVFRPQ